MATIIGVKYDEGILKSACLLERIHNLPNVNIHTLNHGVELVSVVLFDEVLRCLNGGVNLVWPKAKMEGFAFIFLDECNSFIAQAIG